MPMTLNEQINHLMQRTPDEAVTSGDTTFYRYGRRVIAVNDYEKMYDEYADVAAAKMVLDMARS